MNLNKIEFIIFDHDATNLLSKLMITDVIDGKVCWNPDINNVKAKMSKSIAILYKTKEFLNHTSHKTQIQCTLSNKPLFKM